MKRTTCHRERSCHRSMAIVQSRLRTWLLVNSLDDILYNPMTLISSEWTSIRFTLIATFGLAAPMLALDAAAADPIPWRITAVDKQTQAPIEGAIFNFALTDNRTKKVDHKSCTTDAQGTCEVLAHPTTGFFTGGGTDGKVNWDATKYQKLAELRWLPSKKGEHLHVELTSLQYVEEKLASENAKREEDERRIAVQKALREEEQRESARERIKLRERLLTAQNSARLGCDTKSTCEKMFALTEIFVAQHSDMKLQLTTATSLQTYNPTEPNRIGMSAYRIPGKRDASTIVLEVSCKDFPPGAGDENACLRRKVETTEKFRPFVSALLKD